MMKNILLCSGLRFLEDREPGHSVSCLSLVYLEAPPPSDVTGGWGGGGISFLQSSNNKDPT